MLKAVLFDLDDTLLATDSEQLMRRYFQAVSECLSDLGDARTLQFWLIQACERMMQYDHMHQTNTEAFTEAFCQLCGVEAERWWPRLRQFYSDVYPRLGETVSALPGARAAVLEAKSHGMKVAVATNPLFPLIAVAARLQWGGLDDIPFDLITALDNMHYAKPQPQYYQEAAEMIGVRPEGCLVVGNDLVLDIAPAKAAGMWTYFSCDGVCERLPEGADAAGNLLAFAQRLRDGTLPGMKG